MSWLFGSPSLNAIERLLHEYVEERSRAAGINKKFTSLPAEQRTTFAKFESSDGKNEEYRLKLLANIEQMAGMKHDDEDFIKVYQAAMLEVFDPITFPEGASLNALLYFQAGVKSAMMNGVIPEWSATAKLKEPLRRFAATFGAQVQTAGSDRSRTVDGDDPTRASRASSTSTRSRLSRGSSPLTLNISGSTAEPPPELQARPSVGPSATSQRGSSMFGPDVGTRSSGRRESFGLPVEDAAEARVVPTPHQKASQQALDDIFRPSTVAEAPTTIRVPVEVHFRLEALAQENATHREQLSRQAQEMANLHEKFASQAHETRTLRETLQHFMQRSNAEKHEMQERMARFQDDGERYDRSMKDASERLGAFTATVRDKASVSKEYIDAQMEDIKSQLIRLPDVTRLIEATIARRIPSSDEMITRVVDEMESLALASDLNTLQDGLLTLKEALETIFERMKHAEINVTRIRDNWFGSANSEFDRRLLLLEQAKEVYTRADHVAAVDTSMMLSPPSTTTGYAYGQTTAPAPLGLMGPPPAFDILGMREEFVNSADQHLSLADQKIKKEMHQKEQKDIRDKFGTTYYDELEARARLARMSGDADVSWHMRTAIEILQPLLYNQSCPHGPLPTAGQRAEVIVLAEVISALQFQQDVSPGEISRHVAKAISIIAGRCLELSTTVGSDISPFAAFRFTTSGRYMYQLLGSGKCIAPEPMKASLAIQAAQTGFHPAAAGAKKPPKGKTTGSHPEHAQVPCESDLFAPHQQGFHSQVSQAVRYSCVASKNPAGHAHNTQGWSSKSKLCAFESVVALEEFMLLLAPEGSLMRWKLHGKPESDEPLPLPSAQQLANFVGHKEGAPADAIEVCAILATESLRLENNHDVVWSFNYPCCHTIHQASMAFVDEAQNTHARCPRCERVARVDVARTPVLGIVVPFRGNPPKHAPRSVYAATCRDQHWTVGEAEGASLWICRGGITFDPAPNAAQQSKEPCLRLGDLRVGDDVEVLWHEAEAPALILRWCGKVAKINNGQPTITWTHAHKRKKGWLRLASESESQLPWTDRQYVLREIRRPHSPPTTKLRGGAPPAVAPKSRPNNGLNCAANTMLAIAHACCVIDPSLEVDLARTALGATCLAASINPSDAGKFRAALKLPPNTHVGFLEDIWMPVVAQVSTLGHTQSMAAACKCGGAEDIEEHAFLRCNAIPQLDWRSAAVCPRCGSERKETRSFLQGRWLMTWFQRATGKGRVSKRHAVHKTHFDGPDGHRYGLLAVVHREGETASQGHWWCEVRMNGTWFRCNDDDIKRIQGPTDGATAVGWLFFANDALALPSPAVSFPPPPEAGPATTAPQPPAEIARPPQPAAAHQQAPAPTPAPLTPSSTHASKTQPPAESVRPPQPVAAPQQAPAHAPAPSTPSCTHASKKHEICGSPPVPGFTACASHLYGFTGTGTCKHPSTTSPDKLCGTRTAKGVDFCANHVVKAAAKAGFSPPLPGRPINSGGPLCAPLVLATAQAPPGCDPPDKNVDIAGMKRQEAPPDFRSGPGRMPPAAALKGMYLVGLQILPFNQIPQSARAGISASHRKEHIRVLSWLQAMPIPLRDLPLPTAALMTMEAVRDTHTWCPTTWEKYLGTALGAMSRLAMYTSATEDLPLSATSVWRDALRTAKQKAHQYEKRPATEATPAQVSATISRLRLAGHVDIAQQVLISWLTAARVGCTLQLQARDLDLAAGSETLATEMDVTFRRGKGVRFRGPYSVHTTCPAEFADLLPRTSVMAPSAWLWPAASRADRERKGRAVTLALKETHKDLSQGSLRRGSLQFMAAQGTAEEIVQHFSGHTNLAMLRHYLKDGKVGKARADATRSASKRLLGGERSA